MNSFTVGELFAGIGGIGLGFKQNGFKLLWANEIDKKASITYKTNFNHEIINEDMQDVDVSTLPKIDILTGGFPCQAFSIAGYQKGFKDDRGNLFFDIVRYIKVLTPQIVFLENVKNLTSHDKENTFKVIQEKLKEQGYYIKAQVLNTADYTEVPQNRERIYIVCFKDKKKYDLFRWPEKSNITRKPIKALLDSEVSKEFYYTKSIYSEQLRKEVINSDTVYQWRRVYVRENKSNLCPTLTANMGMGGHNVPIILDKKGVRKLTPRECARFQGFPDDFIFPSDLPKSALYKQIGNSVSVPVISLIAKEIMRVLTINE